MKKNKTRIITKLEYDCAVHTLQFYNTNPDQRACMDEAEKKSFSKALWIVKEYHRQELLSKKNQKEK